MNEMGELHKIVLLLWISTEGKKENFGKNQEAWMVPVLMAWRINLTIERDVTSNF